VADINHATVGEATDPDFTFDYVDIGRVTQGAIDPAPLETVFGAAPSRARRLAAPGDTIVSTVRTYLRAVATVEASEVPQVFSTGFAVLHPRRSVVHPRFLSYYLQSDEFVDRIVANSVGVSYPAINASDLAAFDLWLPDVHVQRAISDFLDRETAQIDALIEAQRELVDRLHERRLSVIQSLVLHGAGDGANLSDSGVRWIGEVPKHWQVGCIRRFAQMHSGHTPSRQVADYWVNCNIPWFTLADVWQLRPGRQEYLGQTAEQVSELGLANSAAELLPAGTVVFSRTASVGFSGIMPVAMATSQDFWNWVCGSELLPEYLLYVFRAMKTEFEALRMGSTHQTIYERDAAGIHIPVPPTSEQREIVGLVRQSVARTDDMIDAASNTVALLQERRSALISAAVTGRIDPRTGKETLVGKVLEFA
jgi:type I restriction enzyme S subunit